MHIFTRHIGGDNEAPATTIFRTSHNKFRHLQKDSAVVTEGLLNS